MVKVNIPSDLLMKQLEEALEERQSSDRRKTHTGLPAEVKNDRRKGDRRTERKKPH